MSSFQFFGVRLWHLYFLLSYSIYKTEKMRKKGCFKSDLIFLLFYFTKEIAPKYKGIIGIFDTHITIIHDILCHLPYVIKCHKMSFYGILWHLSDDIKCHELWQYGYQKKLLISQNDLKHLESFYSNKILEKSQKN